MQSAVATLRGAALLIAGAVGLALVAPPVAAEEQALQFKLVTQRVGAPNELPEIGGHKVTVGEYMGVATFADGRIAHKRFVDISDDTASSGSFKGYSTYTFENSDSLTLSYSGGWDGNGAHGEYKVISGTGKFAGATGTGSFTSLDEPWADAHLWDVSLTLTLATQ
jgi:hypothetical protein